MGNKAIMPLNWLQAMAEESKARVFQAASPYVQHQEARLRNPSVKAGTRGPRVTGASSAGTIPRRV